METPINDASGVFQVSREGTLLILSADTNGYPQIFAREGLVEHFRVGPWNGLGFRGLPMDNMNPFYSVEFIVNQKEIYYRYELKSNVVQRVIVTWDGIRLRLSWIKRIQKWVSYTHEVVDSCSRYGPCGPYGSCSFKSSLLAVVWKVISGVKLPDTRRSWYNVSMSLGECEMACIMNCSCTAYANLDIRNGGSGCLLWFDELMDIREYDDHQELYIRMATSELAEKEKASQERTSGYISPEYAVHGRFSIKSDVFSFGVLVLEMISGKKNRGFSHEGHNDNLLGHTTDRESGTIDVLSSTIGAMCRAPQTYGKHLFTGQ
ncbi:hypothetical protein L1887_16469 [Cichorium endivia]|nr:hypothetical protein L1887_16469 [Cichorium endivia]